MKNENSRKNGGCTILIPTYNRPEYLTRLLTYYEKYGEGHNIIVADSSSDEIKNINRKNISSISNLDIRYLDHYSTEIAPDNKIADMVNYVEDKYCVLCADDDFITPNGIKQCVNFLERNPDFAIAHGWYIVFHVETDIRKKQRFCWTSCYYTHESNTFKDAKSRLIEHFSKLHRLPLFYAVHRTDILKISFNESAEFTDDVRFGELLPSMLTLVYGKMKSLDVLYCVRDKDSYPRGRLYPSLSDFIKEGTYDEKYAKFIGSLSTHLSKKSKLDIEESRKVIDNLMSTHMEKYCPEINYKHLLVIKMRGILPDWIYGRIRSLFRKVFPENQMQMDDLQTTIDIPSSKYYEDFNKIRLHVLSYSKK